MDGGMLSQDEINALLAGMDLSDPSSIEMPEMPEPVSAPAIVENSAPVYASVNEQLLTEVETDAVGEIANISMDARRNQVYTGVYRFVRTVSTEGVTSYMMECVLEQCAMDMKELLAWLNEHAEKEITFLGDGVPVYTQQIQELLHKPYTFAPAHRSRQSAAALGMLAVEYYKQGKIQTAAEHEPDYLRVSQAERERMEREGQTE